MGAGPCEERTDAFARGEQRVPDRIIEFAWQIKRIEKANHRGVDLGADLIDVERDGIGGLH